MMFLFYRYQRLKVGCIYLNLMYHQQIWSWYQFLLIISQSISRRLLSEYTFFNSQKTKLATYRE